MTLPRSDIGHWGKLQVWEYGRRYLGYGTYDEATSTVPYQKWAGLEAHKLYIVMRKRKISNREFVLAVDYCHARRLRIENPVWVFQNLALAKEWQKANQVTDLSQLVNTAVAYEQALASADSPGWITRLTRSLGPYRQEVLDEWMLYRNLSEMPSPVAS